MIQFPNVKPSNWLFFCVGREGNLRVLHIYPSNAIVRSETQNNAFSTRYDTFPRESAPLPPKLRNLPTSSFLRDYFDDTTSLNHCSMHSNHDSSSVFGCDEEQSAIATSGALEATYLEVTLNVAKLVVSIVVNVNQRNTFTHTVERVPSELLVASIDNLKGSWAVCPSFRIVAMTLGDLQIDNQRLDSLYPVVVQRLSTPHSRTMAQLEHSLLTVCLTSEGSDSPLLNHVMSTPLVRFTTKVYHVSFCCFGVGFILDRHRNGSGSHNASSDRFFSGTTAGLSSVDIPGPLPAYNPSMPKIVCLTSS